MKSLLLYFDEKDDNWNTYTTYTSRAIEMGFCIYAIKEYNEVTPHWWAIGALPFATDNLVTEQKSTSNEDEWELLGFSDAIADGSNYACRLDSAVTSERCVTRGYYETDNNGPRYLPAGAYRAFIRMRNANVSGRVAYGVYDYTQGKYINKEGTYINSALTTSYAWYILDFVLNEDMVGDQWGAVVTAITDPVEAYVHECVIVPISNGKNLPIDVRNQMLRKIKIHESVKE